MDVMNCTSGGLPGGQLQCVCVHVQQVIVFFCVLKCNENNLFHALPQRRHA